MAETTLLKGLVTLSLGGIYTVITDVGEFACKPRGIFRKEGITPVAGDLVMIAPLAPFAPLERGEGIIETLLPRKNFVTRPAAANIDLLVFVCSVVEPETNLSVLDKFLAVAVEKNIPTLIAVTKNDLKDSHRLKQIYEPFGDVIEVDYRNPETVISVCEFIKGKLVMFTGNSGVGKTTLLNHICEGINAETGEISKKLGRGRHTTRTVQLFPFEGGYIADTPGFSTFDTEAYADIDRRALAECFPDFLPFLGKCEYADCMHIKESGCAVSQAAKAGKISKSRYESYLTMCEERDLKQKKKY
jgi:ribosome biogenesis GTPase